jgi:hypothetical protein
MQGLIQPEIPQKPSVRARAIKSCAALLTGPMRTVRNPWRALKQGMNRAFVKNSGARLQNTYRRQMRAHALTIASVDTLLETHVQLVYFPLHLQPELTTSTLGGVYQDQLYAIELLSSMLGDEWLILVKENPKQTYFQRRELFFRRLMGLTNVRLVPSTYSTYKLMRKARFVTTISGTACWEAVKGGKKCLVFGKAWFSGLPGVYTFAEDLDFQAFLDATNRELRFEDLEDAFHRLMSRAGAGVVDGDYACLVPNYDSAANARKVVSSIVEAVQNPNTVWN